MSDKVNMMDRVEAVKTYCVHNYDNGWCDLVIETLSDWDIADIIENTKTVKGAVHKLAVHFGPYAGHRREVRADIDNGGCGGY
jgi:hypothetical protein